MILKKENILNTIIPDNSETGLVSTINVRTPGNIKNLKVHVNISHPFIGDLQVALKTPSGKVFTLHKRSGGKTNNLVKTYEGEDFETLAGEKVNGKWELIVKDFAPRDQGTLNSWGIEAAYTKAPVKTEIYVRSKKQEVLQSVQDCRVDGRVKDIKMNLNIAHPNVGNLIISLVAPSGKSIVLQSRTDNGQKNLRRTYYAKDTLKDLIGEKTKGRWELRVKDATNESQGKLQKWKLEFKFQANDDLRKMEGIGPKIAELLNNDGIYSFARLSATSVKKLHGILEAAGDRYKMHDPSTWGEQAKMAAAGEWDALKKWQDELDGGRVVK